MSLFEIILELFVDYILAYPGAFVRWAFKGFPKGQYLKIVHTDIIYNAGVSILLFVLIGVMIVSFA